jgi:antitoxin VapB
MTYHTSLNLKSDEAYRLAKELSERTGKSMTAAVIEALQEQLARTTKESKAEFVERIMAIAKGARQEWREPYRSTDYGDLLYDERGLPRDC